MKINIWEMTFLVCMVVSFVIRIPYDSKYRKNTFTDNRKTNLEKFLLAAVGIGMMLIPLIYIFSRVFDFANYSGESWMGFLGVGAFLSGIYFFAKSHADLGLNWSPTLQIREKHSLVTVGVYKYIRHPMYSSIWLWAIAQAFLLQNWIAGFSGIVAFGLMYFLRVPQEEKMMLDHFGEEYRGYMKQTGRVFPRIW
ncbi:protein-S-isoprenylcysteine O-methyltransferase [Candidatus Uabimicrobium amorphum]|uniref:Farnesyl cysteine carboxyl-methyltransferase n=1 Tax=Uabimicrobium amorphum TaxID=2596890 RepID=A0A5S9ITZ4_UABAM|nr:protein-S-isoprenylcysteine O-methyltransferase [Candidatus Uabimicrobium amorphum]BBM88069.1 farnesyl cysteine carboxyl-methyltransferase [Candidatus Uabimicrobium amorphum]